MSEAPTTRLPEVLVTGGGTNCPIDDVRVITNIGTGLFASQLAEALLRRGCRVHYLYSSGARRPFRRLAEVDLDAEPESELARLRSLRADYFECRERLIEVEAPTFHDYAREAKRLVAEAPIEIAVMNMAASDYAPVPQSGKISSDAGSYTLTMHRCEKVIGKLRALRPELFIVGFKLSSGLARDEMVPLARAWMEERGFDLVVANDLAARRPSGREVCLLDGAGGARSFAGADVAPPLVDAVLAAWAAAGR